MIAYTVHLQTEYHLRDFEQALALREVAGALQQAEVPTDVILHVGTKLYQVAQSYGNILSASRYPVEHIPDIGSHQICFLTMAEIPESLFRNLAYVRRIEAIEPHLHRCTVPYQVYLNRLPKLIRNGSSTALPLGDVLACVQCNRREHGYLSHSFHSYKGKYYPQLVGSLLNTCGVQPGDWVLEPFCGSGTTLVECSLRGVNSVGIDMNPLARLITEVKTSAIREPYEAIEQNCHEILSDIVRRVSNDARVDDAQFLPENRAYLYEWFPIEALAEISVCLSAIRCCGHDAARGICLLTLSDSLREISLQDPESLRILRRKSPPPRSNLAERIARGVEKRLAALEVQRHLADHPMPARASARVLQGDARSIATALDMAHLSKIRFQSAITSPPYATALPYIDTDRLSLFALGLLQKGERSELEWAMIGNREISDVRRRAIETRMFVNSAGLPQTLLDHFLKIHQGNIATGGGFRRRNMAALLYKYFSDMQETFRQVYQALDQGGYYAVVIGNSTTNVGDEVYEIRTDDWLTEIAVAQGFLHRESIPMTDQAGYMRHSRNMIKGETIIILQKPYG
jgi:site-specific DNA-methyltransferase (cytosine-N4-specific)